MIVVGLPISPVPTIKDTILVDANNPITKLMIINQASNFSMNADGRG
jgi:hypothetical protein